VLERRRRDHAADARQDQQRAGDLAPSDHLGPAQARDPQQHQLAGGERGLHDRDRRQRQSSDLQDARGDHHRDRQQPPRTVGKPQ
jgi:hypothetical protein